MIGWRDRGCLQMAMLLEGREELVLVWMKLEGRFLAVEAKAEACCAMQMREARVEEAREDLRNDGRVRWKLHREQSDTHQEEDTVAGCRRRHPGSAVAKGRMAATSELGHLSVVAAERRDGGVGGVVRAMGVFLRAEHVLVRASTRYSLPMIAFGPGRTSGTRGSTGQIHSVGCKSRKRVKGAPAVGTSRWRTRSRILSLDMRRVQTSEGDDRYGQAAVRPLRHADTRPHHLTASTPPSSCRMTAKPDQVPESSRRLVPWLQVTAKFRSQLLHGDKALRAWWLPGPSGASLISLLCNILLNVPCAGGHPCGPGPRLPFLPCGPGRNGSRPREKGSAKGICVGGWAVGM
jgi:hypothetical protein